MKTFHDFSPYSELQWTPNVEAQNDSFNAASTGYKRYQTINKGLI